MAKEKVTSSTAELAKHLGREGLYATKHGNIAVKVQVHDVKYAYGRLVFLIRPVKDAGAGEAWVDDFNLHFDK